MSSRQWVQKQRKIFSQRSQQIHEELTAMRCEESIVLEGHIWMKVRNIRLHTVLIDTLKTETRNFVLNPSLHWKPVECSEQCRFTCMPGITADKSGCMILYVLKLIQFVVRDTSKKRITVV